MTKKATTMAAVAFVCMALSVFTIFINLSFFSFSDTDSLHEKYNLFSSLSPITIFQTTLIAARTHSQNFQRSTSHAFRLNNSRYFANVTHRSRISKYTTESKPIGADDCSDYETKLVATYLDFLVLSSAAN